METSLTDPALWQSPNRYRLVVSRARLILACGYLYIIQRYYSGKVNVSKDNQGLY